MLFGIQILGSARRHARGVALALGLTAWLGFAILGLTGCGQKGPLYLPAPAELPSTAQSVPTPAAR